MINEYRHLTNGHKKMPNTTETGASAPVSVAVSGDTKSLAVRHLFHTVGR